MGEGGRFVHFVSRAAFGALERASGSALGSEALFNPENQAALSFQENKEGKDVGIGGRVKACLTHLNAVLPSPKPLTPVSPAPSPRRRA